MLDPYGANETPAVGCGARRRIITKYYRLGANETKFIVFTRICFIPRQGNSPPSSPLIEKQGLHCPFKWPPTWYEMPIYVDGQSDTSDVIKLRP
jgi:hypothetical protein